MQIELSKDQLPTYFTIADPSNSWYTKPTNTFDFANRSSDTLLVTVGDSWTWGSDISEHNQDNSLRINKVWGNQLSQLLDSDWLNLALSAQGNQWMANRVTELEQIIPYLKYDNIIVICVFTGAGRMFNTSIDLDFDYVQWFEKNINVPDDYYKFLEMLNIVSVKQIQSCTQFDQLNLYLTSNMVDSLGYTEDVLPWYKILGLEDNSTVSTDMTAIERLLTIEEFVQGDQLIAFKTWMLGLIDTVERRENHYQKTQIFRNQHPLALYHQLWAEHIYENINNR